MPGRSPNHFAAHRAIKKVPSVVLKRPKALKIASQHVKILKNHSEASPERFQRCRNVPTVPARAGSVAMVEIFQFFIASAPGQGEGTSEFLSNSPMPDHHGPITQINRNMMIGFEMIMVYDRRYAGARGDVSVELSRTYRCRKRGFLREKRTEGGRLIGVRGGIVALQGVATLRRGVTRRCVMIWTYTGTTMAFQGVSSDLTGRGCLVRPCRPARGRGGPSPGLKYSYY